MKYILEMKSAWFYFTGSFTAERRESGVRMPEGKKGFRSLRRSYDRARHERRYLSGIRLGRYVLPPQSIKMRVLEENSPRPCPGVFIETGTYHGETVQEMKSRYGKVVSIEIDKALYEKARERFKDDANVTIVLGDCAKELPKILDLLSEPAVFWLDGHWSGAGTGKGKVVDPVLMSLEQIGSHPVKEHAIFIDDARYFDGKDGRPDIVDVLVRLRGINRGYLIRILNDIVIATADRPVR
jgi:hypothetical protein